MSETEKLKNIVLAPYIFRATALKGKRRNVAGNQFNDSYTPTGLPDPVGFKRRRKKPLV